MKLLALLILFALAQLSAAEEKSAAALIEDLQAVNSPITFYTEDFSFTEFPPLYPQLRLDEEQVWGENGLETIVELCKRGPEVLPLLLKHLDDHRETKTVFTPDHVKTPGISAFLDYRPNNPSELEILERNGLPRENPGPDYDQPIEGYILTVGDMCFALVGMITNRSYYPVVEEFGAQLNSTLHSPQLTEAIRERWSTNADRLNLYQQLKTDLEQGEPRFAISAATRLLYYFPDHSHQLVLSYFRKLIKDPQFEDSDLDQFLQNVSWSRHPEIQRTMRRFLRSSSNPDHIFSAAWTYRGSSDPRARLELLHLADRTKTRRDPRHWFTTHNLLELTFETFPAQKDATLTRFLRNAGSYACWAACKICEEDESPPLASLATLLSNRSKITGARYLVEGPGSVEWPEGKDYLPYRVCDQAYETIIRVLGDKRAHAQGTHEEMDQRIELLLERLNRPKERWQFTADELEALAKDSE